MDFLEGKTFHISNGYFFLGQKAVHRHVWEYYKGKIPKGHHIHHKDGNKLNNSIENLECLTHSDHLRLHMRENSDKLHAWLKTRKGKKFLSEKAKRQWRIRPKKPFDCVLCGETFFSKHNRDPMYCSDNCVQKARRLSGVDNEERTCRICSEKFVINKYQRTQVCSMKCRNLWLTEKRNARPWFDMTCIDCGKLYKGQQPERSRFCSKSCSQRYRIRSKKQKLDRETPV